MAAQSAMLSAAVESYLAVRRAGGFLLRRAGHILRAFAGFAQQRGETLVRTDTAVQWAGLARSPGQRARRLGEIIRFVRHVRVEDPAHELPPDGVFGHPPRRRPTPYIFTPDDLRSLVAAARVLGPQGSSRAQVFACLLCLLACTGLRISEALALRPADIVGDRLLVRATKFRKSRLLVLHPTAAAALDSSGLPPRRLRGADAPLFQWPSGRPLRRATAERTFRRLADALALRRGSGLPPPRLHDLRHTFAERALEAAPVGERRLVARHMLAVSTYLGHTHVSDTYWYLEATPQLMTDIARAAAPGAAPAGAIP